MTAACGLIDVKGLRSPSYSLFRVCSEMDQANYPETLHRFYVVNTPWVFHGIYKVHLVVHDHCTAHTCSLRAPWCSLRFMRVNWSQRVTSLFACVPSPRSSSAFWIRW